jgi:hypothetical protein
MGGYYDLEIQIISAADVPRRIWCLSIAFLEIAKYRNRKSAIVLSTLRTA